MNLIANRDLMCEYKAWYMDDADFMQMVAFNGYLASLFGDFGSG